MRTFTLAGHRRSASRLALAAAAGLALTLSACGGGGSSATVHLDDAPKSNGVRGTALQNPVPKPAIVLTDTAGHTYDLRKQTAGKLTFVYFGYTHCPDVCPTTMADLGAAMTRLSPAEQAKVAVVFVTTDPDRDTGPVMRSWLNQFNRSFVGLRGTWNQINTDAEQLGIPLDKPVKRANGLWTVDHGAQITAFNPDGLARDIYLPGIQVADYVHDVPLLLRNQG